MISPKPAVFPQPFLRQDSCWQQEDLAWGKLKYTLSKLSLCDCSLQWLGYSQTALGWNVWNIGFWFYFRWYLRHPSVLLSSSPYTHTLCPFFWTQVSPEPTKQSTQKGSLRSCMKKSEVPAVCLCPMSSIHYSTGWHCQWLSGQDLTKMLLQPTQPLVSCIYPKAWASIHPALLEIASTFKSLYSLKNRQGSSFCTMYSWSGMAGTVNISNMVFSLFSKYFYDTHKSLEHFIPLC